MYAYAIHTILNPKLIGKGKQAAAGSVFSTDQDEFNRLQNLNAVRTATDEEIAVAETKGTLIAVPETVIAENSANAGSTQPPESGDENDPNSKPKGAKQAKAAAKAKEEEI